ncbi:MAG TPA: peptidase U32 family protein, partial [Polyangiaceae bacterium]|nr:peptidase U32 family protein [Polyangiaceae bacterium]
MLAASLRRPEILAPAGTEEAFAAALASGADAVFFGLSEGFNARARSTAFSLATLPELVRRAHRAAAKVYLAVNTLVFESELGALEELLRGVVASGVDALIVQDPAVAFVARRLSPGIRLHASTQMTISSAEGALFAATLGVSRVVLPRELSADEIAAFTRESALESEVFVHGALCMSWSGQCLTSEAFSERSANRGQCSQACRMPYQAVVDGERLELGDLRYLLSPEDLAAHDVLPELMQAGVHSLKIEGRYKGPAYVSAAVDSWRNWRDAVLRGVTEADRARLERDIERTQLTFSRGGSLGFLRGDDHQRLVVATTPKHRGLALGDVREVRAWSVVVKLTSQASVRELLRPGVGIKFELVGRSDAEHDPEHAPGGPLFSVRLLDGDCAELGFGQPGPELARVRAGDAVRLTSDPELARQAERQGLRAVAGRVALELAVAGQAGEP